MTAASSSIGAITLDILSESLIYDLFQEVGRKVHYEPDSFQLVLQNMSDGESVSIFFYTLSVGI